MHLNTRTQPQLPSGRGHAHILPSLQITVNLVQPGPSSKRLSTRIKKAHQHRYNIHKVHHPSRQLLKLSALPSDSSTSNSITPGGGENAATLTTLKRDLLLAISAANNPSPGSRILDLQSAVENAAMKLAAANPTPSPALSPLMSAPWALLYTGPSKYLAPSQFRSLASKPTPSSFKSSLQRTSDAAYSYFYERFPLIAGAAVGVQKSKGTAARNLQVIDAATGKVDNIVEFDRPLKGRICVSGTAEPEVVVEEEGDNGKNDPKRRLRVVFTGFEVSLGGAPPLRLPLDWLSPVGYVDTIYLDNDTRVSVGDKGSLFVVQRTKL